MSNSLSGWNDTIVALATPAGVGAIGVIRVSGTKAIEIVNYFFTSKDLQKQPSHTAHVGLFKNNKKVLDQVVVTIFKNPASYTGEDIVEISCHGSHYIMEQVIQALQQQGCRLAKAGEFTQRAFLNGKLDLAQAEAVADLIASNTEASRNNALKNIRGGFSNILKELREQLIQFSALIELELDFAAEDVEFADRSKFYALIGELSQTTHQLVQSFKLGNVIKNGVNVAIVGKPNAGKSTLLNTFLNENRAIVSEIAGTTRDTIEEILNIDGILFRLIDTAGIRESKDSIETIGVGKSIEKMIAADIILYIATPPSTNENLERETEDELIKLKGIVVVNKWDTVPVNERENLEQKYPQAVFISAKNNEHIVQLKERMKNIVLQGSINMEDTIVTNARHYQALLEVNKSLDEIKTGLDNKIPSDLLALDIRNCLHCLGEITGEITNEDRLDYIFSKFCIGK